MYVIKNNSLFQILNSSDTEILSSFAIEKAEIEKKQWEKQSWKASGEASEGEALVSRSLLWGARQQQFSSSRPQFRACWKSGERLYYILAMSKARGLFYFDTRENKEIRLFHREEFDPHGFFLQEDNKIITTQVNRDASIHLIKMNEEGKDVRVITSGDCIDENPWVQGSYIYYQTSGLARSPEGHVVSSSSCAIYMLNTANGDIKPIKEHPDIDYLLPKGDHLNNLYYIERPHKKPGEPANFIEILKDLIMFPYRIVVAIFGFLNLFSLIFGKKPLMTAGGAESQEIDISNKIIHGQLVNTLEVAKKEGRQVAVSREWKLKKLLPDGTEETVGNHVLWFDLDKSGAPIYTDGFRVYDASGKELHHADELITFIHAE
ncbi:MAG: hypothetical protein HQM10_05930 [Candidatus Riflebacteria bacterium]|nr:hypothetical protein [Candidatus Riflebacteria bacterium]